MSELSWIDPHSSPDSFPDVSSALQEPDGLLAVGGDLSAERLLNAYASGIFPWYSDGQPILWWSPDPRSVLYPDKLKISRSLGKTLRKGVFEVTMNHAFRDVILACANTPRQEQDGTWITDEMIEAYIHLHELGFAQSVEAWHEGKLCGGLYGISIGCIFFGESMFSTRSDASKVAFAHLVSWLKQKHFHLVDCQVETEHLNSLGAELISRSDFIAQLNQHCTEPCEELSGKHTLSGKITW